MVVVNDDCPAKFQKQSHTLPMTGKRIAHTGTIKVYVHMMDGLFPGCGGEYYFRYIDTLNNLHTRLDTGQHGVFSLLQTPTTRRWCTN